ncbi:MAG: phosphoglucosamine mutase, partial [Desulfobacterales bacterium]|nr:phosphoglucosamine mutase [Desulfobacterales bacterium]
MRHLEKTLPDLYPEIEKKQTIDGLRLNLSEGWILIRPSGTEPLIRLTVEAKALKEAEKIMNQGLRQVKKSVEESA